MASASMLPEPVSQAAQVFAIAMPPFARNAYIMAFADECCEDDDIDYLLWVNGWFRRALLL